VLVVFAALILAAAITVVVLMWRKGSENAELRVQLAERTAERDRASEELRTTEEERKRLSKAMEGVRNELDDLETELFDRGDGIGVVDRVRRRLSEAGL
jgi:chromosome segregation ATPase